MHPTGRQMKEGKKINVREHSGTGWPLRCPPEGVLAAQHGKLSLSPCSSQFQWSREGASDQMALRHTFSSKRSVPCCSQVYLYPNNPLIEAMVTVPFVYPPSSGSLGTRPSLPVVLWGCHTWYNIPAGSLLRCSSLRDPSF